MLRTSVPLIGARGLQLHPMHYTMVGVVVAMFFLLLLSLAKHIGLVWACLVAALSCITLLS